MTSDAFRPVADLLRAVHRSSVPFVLLRYSATWSPTENELDILVPARCKQSFVRRLLSGLPPEIVVVGTKSGVTGVRVLLMPVADGSVAAAALVLDIREVVRKDDAILADFAGLTAAGVDEEDGLPVPADHMQAAFLVARNTWAGRVLSPRHHDILRRTWSSRALAALPELLVRSQGETYGEVVENAIRAPIPRRRRASSQLTRAGILLRHATPRSWVRRELRPSVLAIHGPDGSGKSTSAALVAQSLRDRGVRAIAQHYTGGEIDPDYIARQHAKAARQPTPVASGAVGRAGWWSRARRLALFPVRQLQFQVDVQRKRSADVVVYDRFAFDHLFKEASLALTPRVRRSAARAARPVHASSRTVNVVLEATPSVIRSRKAEMAEDVISEYYATAKLYFGDDAAWISAELSEAAVAAEVGGAFLEGIDTKVRRHWGASPSQQA